MKPFRYKKQLIIGLAICFVVAVVALLNSHRANNPTSPTNAPVATSQQPADHTGGEQASDSTTQPQTPQADASPQQQDAPSPTNNDVTEITNTTSSDVEPTQDTSQASQSADYDFATELDEVTKKATEQASPFVIPDGVEYEPQVVLVTVNGGTTAEELASQLAAKGVGSVETTSVTPVTNDVFKIEVTGDSSVQDAVNELAKSGVISGAQPNYVYHVMEDVEDPSKGDAAIQETNTKTGDTQVADSTDSNSVSTPITNMEPSALDDQESTPTDNVETEEQMDATTDEANDTTPLQNESSNQGDELTSSTADEDEVLSSNAAKDEVNDPKVTSQWALDSMDASVAWNNPALKNSNNRVGVAVLDNGFNADHEDLRDNVVATYNATTKCVGDVTCPNSSHHGTHVAGIVAATSNNNKGTSGVGNNHLNLVLVRLLRNSEASSGNMYSADVAAGYEYVISNRNTYNIRAVNMSLGVKTDASSLRADDIILSKVDEAYSKGIVTVGAAGNNSNSSPVPYICYPADYKTIVSVMNLQNTNSSNPKSVSLSSSSNYNDVGQSYKDISAPGANILSTYTSGYGNLSGTSMASPQVAGVVGLMFAANPNLTAAQAVNELYNTARDIGDPGWDRTYGYGEVNAGNAVKSITDTTLSGPEYLAVNGTATYTVESAYLSNWSFSSSDPAVLSIVANGSAVARACGTATITASSGSVVRSVETTVLGPLKGNTYIAVNGSSQLEVDIPQGAETLSWTWNSADPNVASVDNTGKVYGQSEGTTAVTATLVADPSISFSTNVHVYSATQEPVYGAANNGTLQLGQSGTGSGVSVEGSFTPAVIQKEWTSSNPSVASVDQTGVVTRLSSGYALITRVITYEGGSQVTNIWPICVFGPLSGSTYVGANQQVMLSIVGINAVPNEVAQGWTWSSSNTARATVDQNGLVTGKSTGEVTITATHGTGEDQVVFSHVMRVLGSLSGSDSVVAKSSTQFSVNSTENSAWEWSSANQQVATVSSSGLVTGVYPGTTTITATLKNNGDVRLSKNITVTPIPLATAGAKAVIPSQEYTGNHLTPIPKVTIGSATLTANVDYTVNHGSNVYLSPNTYVVTIRGKGLYTGTISASFTITSHKAATPVIKTGLVYNGREQSGVVAGTGYSLSGTFKATNAGTYTAKAILKDGYTWSDGSTQQKSISWSIGKQSVSIPTARTGLVYNGYAQTGVAAGSLYKLTGVYSATNAGTYTAWATLKNTTNYKWSTGITTARSITWKISPTSIASSTVSSVGTKPYTGAPVTPEPQVSWGGRTLRKDVDYTLAWSNNVNAGTAYITVVGRGNFTQSKNATFGIIAPSISYRTHVQNVGWQEWKHDGEFSGTSGRSLRLEGIYLPLTSTPVPGGIRYRTHVQNVGWQDWRYDGAMSGTTGRSLRLEAIQIELTGEMSLYYDVWYRVHAQNVGWMGWAANGTQSGTAGFSRRLEGIQVIIVPKGSPAPSTDYLGIRQDNWRSFIQRR